MVAIVAMAMAPKIISALAFALASGTCMVLSCARRACLHACTYACYSSMRDLVWFDGALPRVCKGVRQLCLLLMFSKVGIVGKATTAPLISTTVSGIGPTCSSHDDCVYT